MASKHECKHCFQRFESRTQVAKHMYLHKQGHICSQCNKPFASESGLKRHVNANHTQHRAAFKCTICDLSFRLKRDFEKHHLSKHRADKHFECKQCGARFSWLINLTKHEKFHSNQKDASECMSESFIETMKEDSAVIKLYQCEICGKKFNYDFTYAIHLAGHEKAKNPSADESGNTTAESSLLPEGRADKTDTANDLMNEVEKGKSNQVGGEGSENAVMNYIPSEEENKDLFEYLNDCRNRREGKMKRKRKDEVIYDFVMTEDKPFKCTQCSEAFRWQVSLDIHLKVHSGDKTLKVRKPYLSSKVLIAEKMKKNRDVKRAKTQGAVKKDGCQNISKIIYQNESDEDNDIYEDDDADEENKDSKVKEEEGEIIRNQSLNKDIQSNLEENGKINVVTGSSGDGTDNTAALQSIDGSGEEGMDALDLLNSIGKPQTLNNHDYL